MDQWTPAQVFGAIAAMLTASGGVGAGIYHGVNKFWPHFMQWLNLTSAQEIERKAIERKQAQEGPERVIVRLELENNQQRKDMDEMESRYQDEMKRLEEKFDALNDQHVACEIKTARLEEQVKFLTSKVI